MVSRLPCSIAAAMLAAIPAALPAIDFIRGDLNSDGRVGMADGYWYVRWLYQGGPPPECMNAIDVSDQGSESDFNIRGILSAVAVDYSIAEPFPTPGPDPTPNQNPLLVCDSYGHGSLLEDPVARITILDATARGGDDDRVTITIAISSGAAVTGYFGSIRFQDGVVAAISEHGSLGMDPGIGPMRDLSGTLNTDSRLPGYSGFCIGRTFNDRLQFGFLNTVTAKAMPAIPAGELTEVAQFDLCLARGTRAGQYAMVLEAGELVDAATARSVVPALEGGTLTVEADLAGEKGCTRPWVPFQCSLPEDLVATFRLGTARALPGEEVSIPFSIQSNNKVDAYTFSIDFDEEVLEATGIEKVYQRPDGKKYDFQILEFDNRNDVPGGEGVEEGFLVGAVVFDLHQFETGDQSMWPGPEQEVLRFHFRVKPEATATVSEIRFVNGAKTRSPGGQSGIHTVIQGCGVAWTPETARSMVFLSGAVNVIEEIVVFLRGDSDGNGTLDLNDAQVSLSYLYLGGLRPTCYDAADANDDGSLDITDPIAVLRSLFLDELPLPEPYPQPGTDPTPDALGCLRRA